MDGPHHLLCFVTHSLTHRGKTEKGTYWGHIDRNVKAQNLQSFNYSISANDTKYAQVTVPSNGGQNK